jgi:hypothetical protein
MTLPTRLPGYPGLSTTPLEIAYDAGEGLVARVRFVPQVFEPTIATNTALVPTEPCVIASGSLVDAEGQVLRINGRGFVRPANSYTRLIGDATGTVDEWLDWIAERVIDDLTKAWKVMSEFAMFVPPAPPEEAADQSSE